MGGGGGSSGAVSFPDYIERQHALWIFNGWEDTGRDDSIFDRPIYSLGSYLKSAEGPLAVTYRPFDAGYVGNAETFTAPTSKLSDVHSRFDSFNTAVQSLNPEADWASMLLQAANQIDLAGRLNSIIMATLEGNAQTRADTAIDAGKAKVGTGIVEITELASFMDQVKAKMDTAGMLSTVNWTDVEAGALAGSPGMVAAALTAATGNTGLVERTDWDGFITDVVAKLKVCGVLKEIDIATLFQQAMDESTRSIEAAIDAANDAIDDNLLKAVTDAYDVRISTVKAKALRQFNAGMADINAVNGSAQLIGSALIHAQFQADSDRFNSELTLQTYQQNLELHGNNLRQFFQTGLGAADSNVRQRTQLFTQSMQNMVDMLVNRSRFESDLTQLFGQGYATLVGGEVQAESVNKLGRDGVFTSALGNITNMMNLRVEYEQTLQRLHGQIFLDVLGRELQGATAEKQSRDNIMASGIQNMVDMLQRKTVVDAETVRLIGETKRLDIVATAESETANFDLRARAAIWPIEVFERATNVLAAPAGMAGFVPQAPSRAASAIGGGMQGAALGLAIASTPGVNVAAATLIGVGAAFGALRGLL